MTAISPSPDPYDLVVIGGGAAGLVTAAGSARLGARVALIERDRLGGECLWTGCVPSKALLRTAAVAHEFRRADRVGLDPVEPRIDFGRVMDSMRSVIARIQPHDDPERFRAMGVDVIPGEAGLPRPGRVSVDGRELQTRRLVLATGSQAVAPPVEGLDEAGYLTHESALELSSRPGHLVILGAGPVGLEFAQIFRRLGSEVTVVEMAERILPREDAEIAGHLRASLEGEGIRFLPGHRATSVRTTSEGKSLRLVDGNGATTSIVGSEVLVAAGMRARTDGMGLENIGVELEGDGAVKVDAQLRTTADSVWAAGDVTGKLLFTHVADYQARLLVRNLFFPVRGKADYSRVPWAIYTDPTLARVGPTEEEARERYGDDIGVYRFPFDDLDRAITDRDPHGMVKLITDSRGRLIAGHILGAHADALIHEIVVALHTRTRIGSLSQIVHAYPTLPEAIRKAADSYYTDKLEASWLGRLLRWWVRRS